MSETASHVASGKVREIYALDDERLLLVASDRISTFDVVLPTEIPDKGRVLTGLSGFWFAQTAAIAPNHLLGLGADGRSTQCRRLEMLPIECVVRGYLAGSGWKDYLATGEVCGHRLPAGLSESERLPAPIFTPATKAQTGHDENIDRAAAIALVGEPRFDEVERLTLELYRFAAERARDCGIILADTKLEFGLDGEGRLVLADEAFTPDSSRFWPAEGYEPGRPSPPTTSSSCGTTARSSAGTRPPRSRAAGRRRRGYAGPLQRGFRAPHRHRLRRLPRRPERRARLRATVLVRPKAGILDPQGQAVESSLRHLGFAVEETRVGRLVELELATTDEGEARDAAGADVRAAAREPADRELRDRAARGRMSAAESPRVAVVVFPGSNDDRDAELALAGLGAATTRVWHTETELPAGTAAAVLPGGFSYGDYLRCGAIARFSPIMQAVGDFAAAGGLVLGICNGFQILTEAGLLPGTLRPNASLAFVCRDVDLRVARSDTPFTTRCDPGAPLTIPVKHGDGCWFADPETTAALEAAGQLLLRYEAGENPNGSVADVAGVCNEDGNVFGLMPHPEHAVDDLLGSTDGALILGSLVDAALAVSPGALV